MGPAVGGRHGCRPDAASCRWSVSPPVLSKTIAACPRLFAMVLEDGGMACSGSGGIGALGRRQRPRHVRFAACIPSRLRGHPPPGHRSCVLGDGTLQLQAK